MHGGVFCTQQIQGMKSGAAELQQGSSRIDRLRKSSMFWKAVFYTKHPVKEWDKRTSEKVLQSLTTSEKRERRKQGRK